MTKLKLIEKPYGKKRFAIFYKREKLAEFSTRESANAFAEMENTFYKNVGRRIL